MISIYEARWARLLGGAIAFFGVGTTLIAILFLSDSDEPYIESEAKEMVEPNDNYAGVAMGVSPGDADSDREESGLASRRVVNSELVPITDIPGIDELLGSMLAEDRALSKREAIALIDTMRIHFEPTVDWLVPVTLKGTDLREGAFAPLMDRVNEEQFGTRHLQMFAIGLIAHRLDDLTLQSFYTSTGIQDPDPSDLVMRLELLDGGDLLVDVTFPPIASSGRRHSSLGSRRYVLADTQPDDFDEERRAWVSAMALKAARQEQAREILIENTPSAAGSSGVGGIDYEIITTIRSMYRVRVSVPKLAAEQIPTEAILHWSRRGIQILPPSSHSPSAPEPPGDGIGLRKGVLGS